MPEHNTISAHRSLRLIGVTKANEDLECSFACGVQGKTAKKKPRYVTVATAREPGGSVSLLKSMTWEDDKKKTTVQKIIRGIARLEGHTLKVRCKPKVSNQKLARIFFLALKEVAAHPLWGRVEIETMTSADVKNFKKIPESDIDNLLTREQFGELLAEARTIPQEDVDSDVDDESDEDIDYSDEESDDEDAEDSGYETGPESVKTPPETTPPEEKKSTLPDTLLGHIQDGIERVAKNALRVAQSIGMRQDPSLGALVAKLSGWLIRKLEATEPESAREGVLYNTLCSLSLMLSYTDNLTKILYVDEKKQPGKDSQTGGSPTADADTKIGKFDLADVKSDNVKPEDVVQALFDKAVTTARHRFLNVDLENASIEKIDKVVRGSWPKEAGEDQLKAIERLSAAIESTFQDNGRLLNYLGLRLKSANETKSFEDIIKSAISGYEAAHNKAREEVKTVKAAADADLVAAGYPPVGGTGADGKPNGTWAKVDAVLSIELDVSELTEALDAVLVAVNDKSALAAAVKGAEQVTDTALRYILGDEVVGLLSEAPFKGASKGAVINTIQPALSTAQAALAYVGRESASAHVAAQ